MINFSLPSLRVSPQRALAVAVSLALPLALVAGCSSRAEVPVPARPVLVMTVQEGAGAVVGTRSVPGVVVARYASDIGFQVAGRIGKRLVEVGQVVRKDQPLLQLDVSDYALALAAAKAEADQATADEHRFKTLVADGAVSAADNERQKARAEAARAKYQLASNRMRYATLTAPYGGVVTALRGEAGQVVAEGTPVVSMARPGEIEIAADIPEALVAEVPRQQAAAVVSGNPAEHYALALRELSPAASQPLRTYRARFRFTGLTQSQHDSLRLGMTAQVQLTGLEQGSKATASVSLPTTALVKAAGEPAVWVLPAGREHLSLQTVRVLSYQNDTVVVSGLASGSRVVTAGVQKLDGKLRVRAVERTGAGLDLSSGARS